MTVRLTNQTDTQVELNDPTFKNGIRRRSRDESYARDNRVIFCERPHRPKCLLPRCRLVLSSGCNRSEGFSCSLIKKVRELGSIRRKSVCILRFAQRKMSNLNPLLVRKDHEEYSYGVLVVE